MLAVAIIPARYGSTRFPGKPLAAETGKPLIQHVYENVARARTLHRVIVATDDERIAAAVRAFGGEVAMTRGDHATGTDRVAEVAARLIGGVEATECGTGILPVNDGCGTGIMPVNDGCGTGILPVNDGCGTGILPVNDGLEARPTQKGARPTQKGARPTQKEAHPTQEGAHPTQKEAHPTQKEARPTQERFSRAGSGADLIVNVQGDEPEMEPEAIDRLVEMMAARPDVPMGSLACPFTSMEDVRNPACVKVVLDTKGNALYFSRSLIPYPRDAGGQVDDPRRWLLHLGIYAYRPAFLVELTRTPPTDLERIEQLEQLRVLYMGYRIAIAVVQRSSTGIDTPEQYAAFVRRYLHRIAKPGAGNSGKGPSELVRGGSSQLVGGLQGPSQLIDGGSSELVRAPRKPERGPWRATRHTPPHLLVDDTWYLISASTWQDAPFFTDPEIAHTMCSTIEREYRSRDWTLELYVVMPTHYHVVARSKHGRDLATICKRIHGVISAAIRNSLKKKRPEQPLPSQYFNNYWDKCLNTEKDWLQSLEYVRQNPVSSGLVRNAEEWPYRGPLKEPSTS